MTGVVGKVMLASKPLGGGLSRQLAYFSIFCLAMIGEAVSAYQINPLKNKYHGDRPRGGVWEQITQTVHEDITDAALACANRLGDSPEALQSFVSCAAEDGADPRHATGNKYDPLIRGVWWNDDPNQHLFGVHYGTWVVWMRDAHGIVTSGRNWLGRRTRIGPGYKMQYRSHYGDLQFLHAMANGDGEQPVEVQRRIIEWMRFAYAVATENIDPETDLGEVQYPVTERYFSRQSGWTVNHLFAPKFTLGKATIAQVALGSILHVIQDSYSTAHAERAFDATEGCRNGRVVEFHAYGSQSSSLHSDADTRASWLQNTSFTTTSNPVQASAQMILFARRKTSWEKVVEPYLRDQLFCINSDARISSPGRFQ